MTATRYVALLRGINVGASTRVPMARLREVLSDAEATGLSDVVTHLQSGNVIATSELKAVDLEARLADVVRTEFGVVSPVAVRTLAQLDAVIAADPLGDVAATDPSRHGVAFLLRATDAGDLATRLAALDLTVSLPDRIAFGGGELHLWCPGGFHATPLTGLMARELGLRVTVRNWRTVLAIRAKLVA